MFESGDEAPPTGKDCTICIRAFRTEEAQRSHWFDHHQKTCTIPLSNNPTRRPGHAQATDNSIDIQLTRSKRPSQPFICSVCNQPFNTKSAVAKHSKSKIECRTTLIRNHSSSSSTPPSAPRVIGAIISSHASTLLPEESSILRVGADNGQPPVTTPINNSVHDLFMAPGTSGNNSTHTKNAPASLSPFKQSPEAINTISSCVPTSPPEESLVFIESNAGYHINNPEKSKSGFTSTEEQSTSTSAALAIDWPSHDTALLRCSQASTGADMQRVAMLSLMTGSGFSPLSILGDNGRVIDAMVPTFQVNTHAPGQWKTMAHLPIPTKRKWEEPDGCVNCNPPPAPGLDDLWNSNPNSVVSARIFEELSDSLRKAVERDLTLHPQTLLALSRFFAGAVLYNTRNGQAILINTVEAYARTRWLDVHQEAFGSMEGMATITSLPGLNGADRYRGFRPISLGAFDGKRLVIGTLLADLLVTSSVRLDQRLGEEGCSVGGTTTTFVINNEEESRAIRIYLDKESMEAGEEIGSNEEAWNVGDMAIVYQLRQLKTKFHEPSTFLFSRASGPLTDSHACVPATIFTVFDRMKTGEGGSYAAAALFRALGEKAVLFGAKRIDQFVLTREMVEAFRQRCKEGSTMANHFEELVRLFGDLDTLKVYHNDTLNRLLEKVADLLAPTVTQANRNVVLDITQQALCDPKSRIS
ncbi:hypothetical protein BGW39_004626 [Mortierella sp. 14UC]|nr:hypothetical protein BGW39_004626 [Mortierella sp. 14UC]